jgi:hypothetical protein
MDEVVAGLQKLVADARAAAAQLAADGKVVEAAVIQVVTTQAEALLAEVQKLVGKL